MKKYFKNIQKIKIAPLWQDLTLVFVGFFILMYAVAKGDNDLILIIFGIIGGIFMVLGIIELVYEIVKQVSFTTGSALVKVFNIKIYTRRIGFLISMVVRDAQEAKGVSLVFLFIIFLIGFVVGVMM
ncbi:MAG: hypothetical protein Q8P72_00855 [Candidatus Roizmanbacteria bacterium]|nr:hypothetical protein [Candidatus Roizmanbacteria bacterium]